LKKFAADIGLVNLFIIGGLVTLAVVGLGGRAVEPKLNYFLKYI